LPCSIVATFKTLPIPTPNALNIAFAPPEDVIDTVGKVS
jgi:hypothetical protein